MGLKILHGGGFADSRLLDRLLAERDLDRLGREARKISRRPVLQVTV